jgi:hypothetical protein
VKTRATRRRQLGRRLERKSVEQRIQRPLVNLDVRAARRGRWGQGEHPAVEPLGENAKAGRIGVQNLGELAPPTDEHEPSRFALTAKVPSAPSYGRGCFWKNSNIIGLALKSVTPYMEPPPGPHLVSSGQQWPIPVTVQNVTSVPSLQV